MENRWAFERSKMKLLVAIIDSDWLGVKSFAARNYRLGTHMTNVK